ncbi:MAG: SusC/RagA family TonB-linked outer membrane protein [Gemmatimonadaceae bacterium]
MLILANVAPGSAAASTVAGVRVSSMVPRLVGVVRGRVTDRESGQPVPSAQVIVVGALNIGAITNSNGDYVLRGVPSGAVVLRISRIGYEPARVPVTVPNDGEAVGNATLSRAAARLEDVVTTATGDQSRRSLGNVVATVNADSLAKTAPISSVQDILQARTAGVQVIQGQGVIGGSPKIRIRGNSSLSLTNEPLIVVDGIRYDGGGEQGNTSGITINRLSTLDPESIESLDIIKGPSAAALYGTAAANGVIVVKTKRGSTGAPRWTTFAEGGISQIPATYPANFRSFGRNLVGGVPTAAPVQCTITNASLKTCVIDSLSVYNPWTATETNPFANGVSGNVGLQVSGGTEAVKYFVSVDRQGDSGPYKMPDFEVDRITKIRGVAPREEQITPNHLRQTSVRGSFTFPLASNATLDISTSYQDRDLFAPFDGTFFAGLSNQLFTAPGFKNATNGTAREFVGDIFSVTNRLTNERFTGNGSINWIPVAWLHLTAEGGLDNANANNQTYQYPGEGTNQAAAWGPNAAQNYSGIDIYKTNTLQYTGTVRAAGTRQLTTSIGTQTTVGAQWFRTASDQLFGEGYGLGVGATTPTAAAQRLASTTTTQNATYGYYIQEQLSFGDKLFVTGSARTDLNSSFGRNVGNTVYPSANASYVISEEDWFPRLRLVDQLRLRATMGQAGLQPGTTAALAFLSPLTYPITGGSETAGLTIASVGTPSLRPEVTTEVESGFDLAMLKGRLNVEFTYFNKSSRDQIFARPLPPSYGVGGTQTVNIARVTNKGVELTFDAQLLQTRMLAWSLRLNGSHLANKLVDVGDVVLAAPQGTRNVVGYPLFGLWDRPYTFADANADGVITPSEITLAAADAYKGSTLPEYEAGFSNSFQLFNRMVSINTLLDYRGKFWNSYTIGQNRCVSSKNCETVNKPGSSLEDQAAAVAAGTAALNNTRWGLFQKNDFIKLREISVAGNVPDRFVGRYLRGRSAQVVLSGRNLATLWTKYPGIDPEANRLANGNDDLGTPPALRTYNVRLNLAF